jgi:hypothetical protein
MDGQGRSTMNISVARVDLEPAGGFDCCCADDPSVGCHHTSIAGATVGQVGEAVWWSGRCKTGSASCFNAFRLRNQIELGSTRNRPLVPAIRERG